MLRGSVGSGFSVELGARTEIKKDNSQRFQFLVDGKPATKKKYPVLYHVLKRVMEERCASLEGLTVQVTHDLPLGAGFGMSASGALSLALAMEGILQDPVSPIFAYSIAHEAEVLCKTGLGDVVSAGYGGFEVRLTPGIYGTVKRLPIEGEVYLLTRGSISTKKVLSDRTMRRKITRIGQRCLKEFMKHPTLSRFAEVSRVFAGETGLLTDEISDTLDMLSPYAYAGMVMLGDSVYAFPRENQMRMCKKVISSLQKKGTWSIWKTRISRCGAYRY